jgi:MFS family permease
MSVGIDHRRDYRLLTSVNALFFAAIGVSSPLLTLYLEGLGASYATIALILTSYISVTLVAGYGWGRLSDRLGRRKPLLLIGLLILAGSYGWIAAARGVGDVWAANLLAGVGFGAFVSISLAMIGDLLNQANRRGAGMGWFRGLGSLAFGIGAILGGRVADLTSLAVSMALCAVLFAAAALVASPLRDNIPATEPVAKGVPQGQVQRPAVIAQPERPLPAAFLLGVMLWMAAHGASASMWPNFMASFGYSNSAIGGLWGLAAIVETPSMILAGLLSDQIGRIAVLVSGGLAIAGVQLGYLLTAQYLPGLIGVQVLRGYGFGSYTVAAMTYTAEHGSALARGRHSGLFNAAGSAGQLAGMFMGGTLAQMWGFSVMYAVCAALAMGSAGAFLFLNYQTRHVGGRYGHTG